MKRTKTQKGITTIALAVTVMVLFTMAVVAIMAVQEDGIIEYAKLASNKYKYSEAREDVELIMANWAVGKYVGNPISIEDFLEDNFDNVEKLEEGKYKIFHRGYEFIITVDANGNYTISDPEVPSSLWLYEVANGEVIITGFNFAEVDIASSDYLYGTTVTLDLATLTFPAELEGKPVTAVQLKEIIIPGDLTPEFISIAGVEIIKYSNSIKSISTTGNFKLMFVDTYQIFLSKNLISIGGNLFYSYNNTLEIPASVTTIENLALTGVNGATIKYGSELTAEDASNADNWGANYVIFDKGFELGDYVNYNPTVSDLNGTAVDSSKLYYNQKFNATNEIKWRIFDYNPNDIRYDIELNSYKGTVDLISADPVGSLTLYGENTSKLDEICKIYGWGYGARKYTYSPADHITNHESTGRSIDIEECSDDWNIYESNGSFNGPNREDAINGDLLYGISSDAKFWFRNSSSSFYSGEYSNYTTYYNMIADSGKITGSSYYYDYNGIDGVRQESYEKTAGIRPIVTVPIELLDLANAVETNGVKTINLK